MVKNKFYTINEKLISTTKIKKSIFICTLCNVESIESAKEMISRICKENKNASHNCWAYIIGNKADIFHFSDAKEPFGTAGKPMLNALRSYNLTNMATVVTRHYGGVKLGIKGLSNAYFSSVKNTIDRKKIIKLTKNIKIKIKVLYDFNDILLSKLADFSGRIEKTLYGQKIVHIFKVDKNEYDSRLRDLLIKFENKKKLKFNLIS